MAHGYTYEQIQFVAQHILSMTSHRPRVGIVCGTGLGGLADYVINADVIHYSQIPHFPVSTVEGHEGKLVLGILEGKPVVLMKGRFHYYEGYPMWKVTLPIRVMKAMGVDTLLLTNAAGGCNPDYRVGDMMIIKDHIDLPGLSGQSALVGPHDDRLGPRFLGMVNMYDKELRQLAQEIGQELGFGPCLREGTYVLTGGPTFTTVAETRLLKALGADAIGMSTVPEAVVAKHAGMRTFGMSLITDLDPQDYDISQSATHQEVVQVAHSRAQDLQKIVTSLVRQLTH